MIRSSEVLHSITYVSKSRIDSDKRSEEISSLTRLAKRRNEQDGITGVLILENDIFYQTIEGIESNLVRLFDSIKRDSRHEEIKLLMFDSIEKRAFSDWSLDTFLIDDPKQVPAITRETLHRIKSSDQDSEMNEHSAFLKKVVGELAQFRVKGFD